MIITQTPLRLSFFGGNTDFPSYYLKHGGVVLTTAIDKYIYCTVKSRFDDLIRVSYSIKESVDSVENLQHELVRESMKKLGVDKGIEINYLADIPSEGSGLGSSSSVLVGTLNALHQYQNNTANAYQLAKESCEIEIEKLGKPIGVQDQYIAAFGGFKLIEFNKDATVSVKNVEIRDSDREDLDNSLMLFYTGQTRKSSSVLDSVKSNLPNNESLLEENKKLTLQAYELILKGKVLEFGTLLNKYWQLKKKMGKNVSNPEIDKMYDTAIEAGALGGKIAGAGGGGFMLLMVPGSKRSNVRRALSTFRELPFRLERDGSKVIFDVRRY